MSHFGTCCSSFLLRGSRGSPRSDILKIKSQKLLLSDTGPPTLILSIQFHHFFKESGLLLLIDILFIILFLQHYLTGIRVLLILIPSRLGWCRFSPRWVFAEVSHSVALFFDLFMTFFLVCTFASFFTQWRSGGGIVWSTSAFFLRNLLKNLERLGRRNRLGIFKCRWLRVQLQLTAQTIRGLEREEHILTVRVTLYRRVRLLEFSLSGLAQLQPVKLFAGRYGH